MPTPDALRVALLDPSAQTPPYDHLLAAALSRAGADVELITSRFLYGPVPPAEGYARSEAFYGRSTKLGLESRGRLPVKVLEHPAGMGRARALIAERDIAHWQWLTLPRIDRALLGRSKPPRVFTLHYPLPAPGDASALRSQRSLLERFDAVVVHTEAGAERLRDEVGLDPASVEVIPHGPLDYLTSLPHEEPLAPELAGVEGPVILFFGLLRPYKGVDDLIEAFARIDRGRGAELWIAGMPRMPMEPLRAAAERAPGTVRFLPRFIPDPEIPALMRRADILALPYREIEQSGVLHAGLAFGKAMVLGDVGGFSEVGGRGAARLVPPGDVHALADALDDLIAQPERRDALAAAAAAAAEGDFGWDAIAARTLSLYDRIIG